MTGRDSGAQVPVPRTLREFVGFAWQADWTDQVGMLVEAYDVTEAVSIVQAALPGWRVSLWNEEDASRAR